MTNPETTTAFAGVDGRTDAQLPAWYARTHSDPVTFAESIRELPQATETEVAYRNRYTDEWIETDRFNALVEPVRLFEAATGEPDEAPLFHVPTDSYAIINPVDVYAPLEDVLRTEELDGVPLGGSRIDVGYPGDRDEAERRLREEREGPDRANAAS